MLIEAILVYLSGVILAFVICTLMNRLWLYKRNDTIPGDIVVTIMIFSYMGIIIAVMMPIIYFFFVGLENIEKTDVMGKILDYVTAEDKKRKK